jgi:hypothetical protein
MVEGHAAFSEFRSSAPQLPHDVADDRREPGERRFWGQLGLRAQISAKIRPTLRRGLVLLARARGAAAAFRQGWLAAAFLNLSRIRPDATTTTVPALAGSPWI